MLDKLGGAFAPKPSSGPHKSRECLPLILILRNRLKYALDYREVQSILMQRHVLVDNKVRTDKTYPVGFMDVVSIPKTNENFRLLYDTKGRQSSGKDINALEQHIKNLLSPSTPLFFNTLYDPYRDGADFVRGYPFSLREGMVWCFARSTKPIEGYLCKHLQAPVIIFVEDFDRFAGVRGKFIYTKKQDHEAFINQLLVELDGFEKQDGVVLMATTRNLSQIDPALKRPGRMDRIFNLSRPTQAEREKILWLAAKDSMDPDIVDSVDWSKLYRISELVNLMLHGATNKVVWRRCI